MASFEVLPDEANLNTTGFILPLRFKFLPGLIKLEVHSDILFPCKICNSAIPQFTSGKIQAKRFCFKAMSSVESNFYPIWNHTRNCANRITGLCREKANSILTDSLHVQASVVCCYVIFFLPSCSNIPNYFLCCSGHSTGITVFHSGPR